MIRRLCPTEDELAKEGFTAVVCHVCHKEMKSTKALRMHLKVAHCINPDSSKWTEAKDRALANNETVEFHCPVPRCIYAMTTDRHFSSYRLLKQHYMKVHAEKTQQCPNCDAAFSLVRFLHSHQKDNCPKRFGNPTKKKTSQASTKASIYQQKQWVSESSTNLQHMAQHASVDVENFDIGSEIEVLNDNVADEMRGSKIEVMDEHGVLIKVICDNAGFAGIKEDYSITRMGKSIQLYQELEEGMECGVVHKDIENGNDKSGNSNEVFEDHCYTKIQDQNVDRVPIITKSQEQNKDRVPFISKSQDQKPDRVPIITKSKRLISNSNILCLPKPNIIVYPMGFNPRVPLMNQVVMIADLRYGNSSPPKKKLPLLAPARCVEMVPKSEGSGAENEEPSPKKVMKTEGCLKSTDTQTETLLKQRVLGKNLNGLAVSTQTGVKNDGTSAETQTSGDLILKQAMASAQILVERESKGSQVSPRSQRESSHTQTNTPRPKSVNVASSPSPRSRKRKWTQTRSNNNKKHRSDFAMNTDDTPVPSANTIETLNRKNFATNTEGPSRRSQGHQIEMQLHVETQTLLNASNQNLQDSSCISTQTLESFLCKETDAETSPTTASVRPKTLTRLPSSSTGYYRRVRALHGNAPAEDSPDHDPYLQRRRTNPMATSTQSSPSTHIDSLQIAQTSSGSNLLAQNECNGTESPRILDSLAIKISPFLTAFSSANNPVSDFSRINNYCSTSGSLPSRSAGALMNQPSSSVVSSLAVPTCTSNTLTEPLSLSIPSSGFAEQNFIDMCTNTDMDILTSDAYVDMQTTTDFDLPTFLDTDTQTASTSTEIFGVGPNLALSHTETQTQTQMTLESQAQTQTTMDDDGVLDLDQLWTHMETQTSADDFLAGLGLVDIETQTQMPSIIHNNGVNRPTHQNMATSYDPSMNTVETQTQNPQNSSNDIGVGCGSSSIDIQTQTLFDSLELGNDISESQFGSMLRDF